MSKKKTTEEYKLELKKVNKKNDTNIRLKNNIEYINANTKIPHICSCGKEWNVIPHTILSGESKSCGLCFTFKNWCIKNNRQDVLKRWDYELNDKKPDEITYSTPKKYYFKCPRRIHKSELKKISAFTSGQGNIECVQCSSFSQWGLDNMGKDFLDKYWDYEKNNKLGNDPWKISYGSRKIKIYIKCQEKDYHGSYDTTCLKFINGGRCNYCHSKKIHSLDSFAQYLINTYGENALELYWDYEKNTDNPWKLAKHSNNTFYIKCQEKDYHESYPISPARFTMGNRCIYCSPVGKKVHSLDSLGTLYPQVLDIWSDKNDKSPYEYRPYSNQEVYWKCPDGIHEDYPRKIGNSNIYDFRCPECQYSKGEEAISNYLIDKGCIKIDQKDFNKLVNEEKHNKILYYIPQKEFKELIGLGGRLLSYDFYIPKLNFLIEYDGEFHYKPIKLYKNEPIKYAEERFKKQQIHDKLKDEYAKNNNIKLLRIPYWEFNNIEKILDSKIFIYKEDIFY